MKDQLKEFIKAQEGLVAEREKLTARLRDINATMFPGATHGSDPFLGTRRRLKNNPMSLRDAILKVTENRALTKEEILDAVLALGYTFTTDDPLNSIGVIIYGKEPKFINEGGRFRPR